jgi:hypothetical protein
MRTTLKRSGATYGTLLEIEDNIDVVSTSLARWIQMARSYDERGLRWLLAFIVIMVVGEPANAL